MLKVWPYWIVRPKTIFIAVEGTLIGILLLHAVWISQSQPATRAAAGSLGPVVALLACQVAFHLNKLDLLMLTSKPQIFLLKTLQSVAAGLAFRVSAVKRRPCTSARSSHTHVAGRRLPPCPLLFAAHG